MNLNRLSDESAIKMAAFREKRKPIWHAFNALDEQGSGSVPKSRLKVLTHNISNVLGYSGAEDQFDVYIKTTEVSFKDYLSFLNMVVFESIDFTTGSVNFDKVDNVCWMVCGMKYKNREKTAKISDGDAFKFWQIFNCFVELDETNELVLPLAIDFEEVELLLQNLMHGLGKSWEDANLNEVREHSGSEPGSHRPSFCSFQLFLDILEIGYLKDVDSHDVTGVVEELYDEVIRDVIKKGWLTKKGQVVASWRERWFVLTPSLLSYYAGRDMKELKGEIPILSTCKVEALPDRNTSRSNRFLFTSESRSVEMSARDLRSKNEWTTAIQEAIKHTSRDVSYQKCRFEKRKAERQEKRRALLLEFQRKEEMEERLRTNTEALEAERQARADAEARCQEQAALREAEEQRRKELEEMQEQLQKSLEEERQAKRDEEIVRALQEELLEEEKLARAALERLKSEQDAVILSERQRREELEQLEQEQTAQLEEERQRLEKLALERQAADEKLLEAIAKLHEAEKSKEELQAKVKAKEKPIGLARPIQPDHKPLISHRGPGAFVPAEFVQK